MLSCIPFPQDEVHGRMGKLTSIYLPGEESMGLIRWITRLKLALEWAENGLCCHNNQHQRLTMLMTSPCARTYKWPQTGIYILKRGH